MKKKEFHSDTEFIPCGVEVDHFRKASDPGVLIPEDIACLPRPIAGYFGALNERLDAELLVRTAQALPDLTIVLIGPVFADFGLSAFEDRWASVLPGPEAPGFRLKSHPENLHIQGIRPYAQLPSYLKAFDLCLLPYCLNDTTRDIHPVKILEYLAAGKRVVSTYLPDIEYFYRDWISISRNSEEFIRMIRETLGSKDSNASERQNFAAQKTWERMAERMKEKMVQSLPEF